MKHKLLLSTPLLVLLCFGLLAYVPTNWLLDSDLLPNSVIPFFTLIGVGTLAFISGCVFGIVVAIRRKQPRWYAVPLCCVLAGVLALFIATLPTVEGGVTNTKVGVVLAAGTKMPIAGAYVIVRWYHHKVYRFYIGPGGMPGAGDSYSATVRTDARGRFVVPAPSSAFRVSYVPSITYINEYSWELNVYAPGYCPPRLPASRYGYSHPSVDWNFSAPLQKLAPILMTKSQPSECNMAHYLTTVVPMDFACWYKCGPLKFADVLYREAYPLVCEQGNLDQAESLAQLRIHAWPAMPELASDIKQSMVQLMRRDHPMQHLPEGINKALCTLLKQSNGAKL